MTPLQKRFTDYRGLKSQKKCAEELGIHEKYLSRILNGHVHCGRKLAERMEEWSGGKISAVFAMFPDRLKKI